MGDKKEKPRKEEKKHTYNKNFLESWENAINGIIYATTTQSNIKKQLLIIIAAIIISLFFHLSRVEFLCFIFSVILIMIVEMINTAIETTMDLFCDIYHPKAKIAKDVGAGAVVLAAINCVIVSYFLFFDKITAIGDSMLESLLQSPVHLAFTTVGLTLIAIVALKATNIIRKKKQIETKFIPSGASAVAFMASTIIWLATKNMVAFTLANILAILVAAGRVESHKRTWGEIIFGAFIGIAITIVVYGIANLL